MFKHDFVGISGAGRFTRRRRAVTPKMNEGRCTLTFSLFALLFQAASLSEAEPQYKISHTLPKEYQNERNPFAPKRDYSWINKPWKSSGGEPYTAFRMQIDGLAKKGADPAVVRQLIDVAVSKKDAARRSPWDPLVHFRHAYSAYMACRASSDWKTFGKVGMTEANERFMRLHFPGQREYARTYFLFDLVTPQPVRRKLGKRLHALDPEDRRVLHVLIQQTNPSASKEERADAIRLADELVAKWPTYTSGYAVRAGVYDRSFFSDHKRKADGQLALKCYQEYLDHAKPTEAWRKDAVEHMQYIESELRKLKP